jgi:hypothetical protein
VKPSSESGATSLITPLISRARCAVYFLRTQWQVASPVTAVVYVTAINIFVHLIGFFVFYWYSNKFTKITVAWRSLGKYLILSVIAAVALFLLPTSTTILTTLGKVVVGLSIYVVLLILVDSDARMLVRSMLREIRTNLARQKHQPAFKY